MNAIQALLGIVSAVIIAYLAVLLSPSSMWYEYKSIVPVKSVLVRGEKLKMLSTLKVYNPGTRLSYVDQLRAVGKVDELVQTKTFTTALRTPDVNGIVKSAWVWGKIPDTVKLDTPHYIRSIQTITVMFGIKKTVVYDSEPFTVVDFDYTKQQQQQKIED